MSSCDLCGGPLILLGALGRLMHYRCRNCGADSSSAETPALTECPTCEGPVGAAGRSVMYDRPCRDACHDDAE
jgi:hypothetical protein